MAISALPKKSCGGFTLVELIVVMVLSSILAVMLTDIIISPVTAYVAQSRRAELVDIADGALDRISRDLRDALPNSIRTKTCPDGPCLEFLHTIGGGRYRADPPGDYLDLKPSAGDTTFDWLGPLTASVGANLEDIHLDSLTTNCKDATATCLVIYNTGHGSGDAYRGLNVAVVTNVTPSAVPATPHTMEFSFADSGFAASPKKFPASPDQRFYLVNTPVSYLCDTSQKTLRRYQDYSIQSNHNWSDTHAELIALTNPAKNALLATQVESCEFTYTSGTSSRNALVTISLQMTVDGESVVLHQQVQVSNTP